MTVRTPRFHGQNSLWTQAGRAEQRTFSPSCPGMVVTNGSGARRDRRAGMLHRTGQWLHPGGEELAYNRFRTLVPLGCSSRLTTSNGSGYISKAGGLPNRSTGYWVPDKPLTLEGDRYTYPAFAGVRRMSYVGFAPTIATIPAGTLVRVSLARWWRPQDADDSLEERCYLQLSGWF
jgi:hypothetical protein